MKKRLPLEQTREPFYGELQRVSEGSRVADERHLARLVVNNIHHLVWLQTQAQVFLLISALHRAQLARADLSRNYKQAAKLFTIQFLTKTVVGVLHVQHTLKRSEEHNV